MLLKLYCVCEIGLLQVPQLATRSPAERLVCSRRKHNGHQQLALFWFQLPWDSDACCTKRRSHPSCSSMLAILVHRFTPSGVKKTAAPDLSRWPTKRPRTVIWSPPRTAFLVRSAAIVHQSVPGHSIRSMSRNPCCHPAIDPSRQSDSVQHGEGPLQGPLLRGRLVEPSSAPAQHLAVSVHSLM